MFTTVLLVAGLIFLAAGLGLILTAAFPRASKPEPKAEGLLDEVAKVLEQFNKLLDKFEQRFRIGILLLAVGLALIGLAAFFEAKQAKDDAKDAKKATSALVVYAA
jgi:sulfite exporter TauE/SafE